MSIGSFVVSLRVFLIDNVFSVCFTSILRWFFSSNKYYYYYYYSLTHFAYYRSSISRKSNYYVMYFVGDFI